MNACARDVQLISEHINMLVGLNKMVDSIIRSQQRGCQTLELVLYVCELARALRNNQIL